MNDIPAEQLEIIEEFTRESRDLIDHLEPSILDLEKMIGAESQISEENFAILNSIFRLFHSLKGGAGFLGLNHIVRTTHTAENLLEKLRSNKIKLTNTHVDLLCQACDFAKEAMNFVEINMNDLGMAEQAQLLINSFEQAGDTVAAPPSPKAPEPSAPPAPPVVFDLDFPSQDLVTPEVLERFLQEADDLFLEIEEDLLNLTKDPYGQESLSRLFRNIHSFKGNCGFLGYNDLQKLSHDLESILDLAKSGANVDRGKIFETMLQLLDVFKEALAAIPKGGNGSIDSLPLYLELISDLMPRNLQAGAGKAASRIGDILVEQGVVTREHVEEALDIQRRPIGELLVDAGVVGREQVDSALKIQKKIPQGKFPENKDEKPDASAVRQDIRVDLNKLDSLVTLIGELVIAENMVLNNPDLRGLELENFSKAGQHLLKIVRELQEMAMTIRMIPVSGLFRRMMRLVHDLSRKSGKKVDLQLIGESTEVDKTVIEKITDPLVHLIRNAMDHGLETQDERLASGKPKTGTIKLAAVHEEGNVLITISDDGQGLDRGKLLQKAIEKHFIEGDGSKLSDREVFNLIFMPGFSTAKEITDVSGRGVGMDVVRQNLEKIRGKVEIHSQLHQGTTIVLRIPLTLAIIDGMLIRVGKSYYILPILSIRESFQVDPKMVTVSPDGLEMVRVREKLLPVIRLHDLHAIIPDSPDLHHGILIVLEAQGGNICLFVDELMGQQQTVIKGLSDYLTKTASVRGVSGCTILGNGDVCLILDVQNLVDIPQKA